MSANTTPQNAMANAAEPANTGDSANLATLPTLLDCPVGAQPSAPLGKYEQYTVPIHPNKPTQPCTNGLDAMPSLFIVHFPHGSPGARLPGARDSTMLYQSSQEAFGTSPWAPFHSQCDWEINTWAKMRGPSSSAMEELFAIPEAIYGNPDLAQDLITASECHYSNQEWTDCIYSEMHTGDWWWKYFERCMLQAILTSSNLLTYIPTTKLETITNKLVAAMQLPTFTSCMQAILEPITTVSEVGIAMMSGDGVWR
ncbi:hypothetical protein EI94DRAFT_1699342 [Lactarius quietus]|nr:hypothetical protein EI94DRAFT_1699342 [Lactarius quietus]